MILKLLPLVGYSRIQSGFSTVRPFQGLSDSYIKEQTEEKKMKTTTKNTLPASFEELQGYEVRATTLLQDVVETAMSLGASHLPSSEKTRDGHALTMAVKDLCNFRKALADTWSRQSEIGRSREACLSRLNQNIDAINQIRQKIGADILPRVVFKALLPSVSTESIYEDSLSGYYGRNWK
jgi:hypothetical protein